MVSRIGVRLLVCKIGARLGGGVSVAVAMDTTMVTRHLCKHIERIRRNPIKFCRNSRNSKRHLAVLLSRNLSERVR